MPKRPLDLRIWALTSRDREVGALAFDGTCLPGNRGAIMSATHKSSVRRKQHHGILPDHRGQDQPTDKSRAQQVDLGEDAGEEAQRIPRIATTPRY
jgi:hypothetical protein